MVCPQNPSYTGWATFEEKLESHLIPFALCKIPVLCLALTGTSRLSCPEERLGRPLWPGGIGQHAQEWKVFFLHYSLIRHVHPPCDLLGRICSSRLYGPWSWVKPLLFNCVLWCFPAPHSEEENGNEKEEIERDGLVDRDRESEIQTDRNRRE